MIKTLDLKIGKSSKAPLDNIKTTSVNLFIGPSNSGKSTLLAEILRYCRSGSYDDDDVLLNTIEFAAIESKAAAEKVERITMPPAEGESIPVDHIIVGDDTDAIAGVLQRFCNQPGPLCVVIDHHYPQCHIYTPVEFPCEKRAGKGCAM